MKRLITAALILLTMTLLLASKAGAQNSGASGTVLGLDGNPMADATITIKSDSGRTFTTKTDKSGKFIQVGVPDGIYTVTLTSPSLNQPFSTQFQMAGANTMPWDINLKQIADSSGATAAASAAKAAFAGMKAHFDAATTAMTEADGIKKQLATTPADQKADLTSKMNADYNTAITEYTAAEQGVGPKDTKNHALILANMGRAQDAELKFDDAATSYQKAIDLGPSPDYYSDLSTSLANSGAAQRDPAVLQQKVTDADAACQKAVALAGSAPAAGAAPAGGAAAGGSGTIAARCYKNMGIVLSNKGDLKQAIDPLKKATDANPKDAQAWFLLGSAYVGTVDSKTDGGKEIFTFDPNAAPSLQKCIDNDAPGGSLAAQCKDMLDSVNTMSGGVATTVGNPTPPKKKGK